MILPTNQQIDAIAAEILHLRQEYEFHSFWLGTTTKGAESAEQGIALKGDMNRRLGQCIEKRAPDLEARLRFPDVRAIVTWPGGAVRLILLPLYVAGRYLKFSREIPQSRWPCRWCDGLGCERCEGTGKRYQRTVEEIVAAPLLALSGAEGTKMHTVGREDVDARMLGRGRPFILELARPRVRRFDLAPVEERLNRQFASEIGVRQMRFAQPGLLERLRHLSPDKSYRARVRCAVPARRESVERLSELRDLLLQQETPRRVLHRRSNRLRPRTVRWCRVENVAGGERVTEFDLVLRTEAGAYIKEFVSGDEGRTEPCVSRLVGIPCDCVELDVLEVFCEL